jgi:hypothetical protein
VLTSHRDLRDVAASLVRKFGSEAPLASLRETVDHHAKWTRVAAFDLRYEDLLKDEKGQVERVAGALRLPAAALAGLDYAALAHEIGREKFDAKRSTAERYDAVNLLHDGHVTDGRHGSWSGTLSAAARSARSSASSARGSPRAVICREREAALADRAATTSTRSSARTASSRGSSS